MDIKQLWEGELVSKSKPSHLDGGIDDDEKNLGLVDIVELPD